MRTSRPVSLALLGVAGLVGATTLAACGSSSSSSSTPPASSAPASSAAGSSSAAAGVSLKGICPDTVVLQTDWNPESEHGGAYEMIGPGYTVDAGKKTVTGPLTVGGQDTGVKLQIRTGGPAIGYQTVTSQMYLDSKITLGYVSTDEAAQFSASQPTIGVFAEGEKSPQMIMWDPTVYPDVKTIADLGAKGTKVRYFQGAAYMEYLIGAGILKKSQTDGSYDGTPASYVADAGKSAQQGFASAEPYIYEHEVKAWDKKVAFQLINDTGYPIYPEAVSVKADKLATLTPCLTKLVPLMQQAQVDYMNDPAAANKLIIELVGKYKTGWTYDDGVANFAVGQFKALGLVGNGDDDTLGNFEAARVQKIIDIVKPIFAGQHKPIKDGLTPDQLFTNQFIDTSIGLK